MDTDNNNIGSLNKSTQKRKKVISFRVGKRELLKISIVIWSSRRFQCHWYLFLKDKKEARGYIISPIIHTTFISCHLHSSVHYYFFARHT